MTGLSSCDTNQVTFSVEQFDFIITLVNVFVNLVVFTRIAGTS